MPTRRQSRVRPSVDDEVVNYGSNAEGVTDKARLLRLTHRSRRILLMEGCKRQVGKRTFARAEWMWMERYDPKTRTAIPIMRLMDCGFFCSCLAQVVR